MGRKWRLIGLATMMAALLPPASAGRAQSAADHAALAHGKPIVGGHDVQPTPDVVRERWRHHELMLRAEAAAKGKSSPSAPEPGASHKVDGPASGSHP